MSNAQGEATRPKDMTPAELAAIPERDPFRESALSPYGLAGDDLLGFWQDRDGKWWREPPMFL